MSPHRCACALALAVLAIAVINGAIARKDQGEYWVTVTKEEALIPESKVLQVGAAVIANELIEGHKELVVLGGSESEGEKKAICDHETEKLGKKGRGNGLPDDFEPRANVLVFRENDTGLKEKQEEKKHFADDFEPRPNVSAYGDDDAGLKHANSKQREQKHFADNFEPRPNVSAYGEDDVGMKMKN